MEQLPVYFTTPYNSIDKKSRPIHSDRTVTPSTHGPALTADSNDRQCPPTMSIDILTADIDDRQSCTLLYHILWITVLWAGVT